MLFLILTIIAAVVLVGLAIRRLPYLRTHRLGLEITSPRPYINTTTSSMVGLWQRVVSFFQGITSRKVSLPQPNFSARQTFSMPASPSAPKFNNEEENIQEEALPQTAHPGDFWHEEPTSQPAALELPTKGLITRRSESQKIAHELLTQADAAFRKKNYKDAEKFYLQAATKDPDNARIYNRLGVIYLQTKNYKDAVEAFRGALKFDDRIASRHYNLALSYLGKRDYRSAEKGLKEAIRLDPTNEKYRKTLSAIQQQPV